MSSRGLWFGPGGDPEVAARYWVGRISDIREQARSVSRYMEVQYEELVTMPTLVLQAIGEFIALPFDPRQLLYYQTAASRLTEMVDIRMSRGTIMAQARRENHKFTLAPPQPSRIGRWRQEMSPLDVTKFENIAGVMLTTFGYELSDSGTGRFISG